MMQPTMVRGLSGYREDIATRSQHQTRIEALAGRLRDADLDAAIVYGDPRQFGRLCYLSGMVPMSRWAVLVVPVSGVPTVLAAVSGSRDLPFMSSLTAVDAVTAVGDLAQQIPELVGPGARIGLVAESGISSRVYRALHAAAAMRDLDAEVIDGAMRSLEPGEAAHLMALTASTDAVADAIEARYRDGAEPVSALIDGERDARMRGAHDARFLVSLDGGLSMRPFEGGEPVFADPLVFELAVEIGGYWASTIRTVERSVVSGEAEAARGALATAKAIAAAGGSAREVLRALEAPRGMALPPLIAGRQLVRLGLWQDGAPVAPGDGPLRPGLYGLRAGALTPERGAIVSEAIHVAAGTTE